MLERILDSLRPGTAKIYVNPIILFLLLVFSSIIIFILNTTFLATFLLVVIFFDLVFLKKDDILGQLSLIGFFTLFYIASSIILQFVVGVQNYQWIVKNSLRIATLGLLSMFALKTIDVVSLVKTLGKTSPRLSMIVLLSINTFDRGIKNLLEIHKLITINAPIERGGLRDKIRRTSIIGEAVIMNLMDEMIMVSEAFFIRQNQLDLGEKRFS